MFNRFHSSGITKFRAEKYCDLAYKL